MPCARSYNKLIAPADWRVAVRGGIQHGAHSLALVREGLSVSSAGGQAGRGGAQRGGHGSLARLAPVVGSALYSAGVARIKIDAVLASWRLVLGMLGLSPPLGRCFSRSACLAELDAECAAESTT